MVSTPLLLLTGAVVFGILGGLVLVWLNSRSYKNTAHVARQTGQDPNDVIWYQDKFRVVNKEGAWIIEFKKIRERTRSVDGRWWTKFLKKSKHAKFLEFTPEEWQRHDMRAHVGRGLFFYETTEGEFYPMHITRLHNKRTGETRQGFSVLDQDNRQFVINEIKSINDLTRNRKKEVTLLIGIVVGIIALALIGVVAIWWLGHSHDVNVAQTARICSYYANDPLNVTELQRGVFLEDIVGVLGG